MSPRRTTSAPRRAVASVVVAVVAMVASGCAVPGGMGPDEAPAVTTVESPEDYFTQTVTWGPCDDDLLADSPSSVASGSQMSLVCATVLVPADWESPDAGVDFFIQMMKLTPDPQGSNRDAIFINPGGPGGSGVEQVQTSSFPPELLDAYDIIGFDPRGVGASVFSDGSTIRCSDELDYLSYFESSLPRSLADYEAMVESSNEYYRDCVERNPLWWTLSTASVVKDLDLLRLIVTGDKPLNFIGSSYGTTIAGRYVTEFPEQVGKIVFDSPTTVSEDRIASALQSLEADEEKLRGFLNGYAESSGVSFDEAWSRLLQVKQWALEGQLWGFAGPVASTEQPGAQVSSEALVRRGILTMNYLPEDIAQDYFTQGLDQAYNERWNGLFEWFGLYIDGYDPDTLQGASLAEKTITRSNEFEVRVIVNSMDYASPDLTEEQQRELSAEAKRVAPLLSELSASPNGYEYFGPPLGLSFSTIARDDPAIPTPPDTPFIPMNTSGVPVLVVGSTNESVTPFSFAIDTAKVLNSPLIAVESSLHAPVAYYSSLCVNDIIVSFFTTDTPVADTTCPG